MYEWMDEFIYFSLHKTFLHMQYNYCKFCYKKNNATVSVYMYDGHPINIEIIYNLHGKKIQLKIRSQNDEKLSIKMYTRCTIGHIICIYI